MHRSLKILALLFGLSALALVGCTTYADTGKDGATLVLRLPTSIDAPAHAPDRVTTLKIDGKDYTEPRSTRRTITLDKVPDKAVKIVYSFWPNSYTNIVRTRVVSLNKGDVVKLDFTKEDPKAPRDDIRPIYYPTPQSVVEKMCEMAKVAKTDVVWDIGCGDGRMVITAVEKFNAKKGLGIDLKPELVKKCQDAAKAKKIADRCFFRVGNALEEKDIKDLPEASVVLLYLGEHLNMKLRPILQAKLKPGSRIVSHLFDFGDWKPDETKTFTAKNNYGEDQEYTIHLWKIKGKAKD